MFSRRGLLQFVPVFLVIAFIAATSRPMSDEFSLYALINGTDIWNGQRMFMPSGSMPNWAEIGQSLRRLTELGQGSVPMVFLLLVRGLWFQIGGWIGYQVEALGWLILQVTLIAKLLQRLSISKTQPRVSAYVIFSLCVYLAYLQAPTLERNGIQSLATPPASFGWYGLLAVPSVAAAIRVTESCITRKHLWVMAFIVSCVTPFASLIFPCFLLVDALHRLRIWELKNMRRAIEGCIAYVVGSVLWLNNFFLWSSVSNREVGLDPVSALRQFWVYATNGSDSLLLQVAFWSPLVGPHSVTALVLGIAIGTWSSNSARPPHIRRSVLVQLASSIILFRLVNEIMEMPAFTYSAWWHDGSIVLLSSVWYGVFGLYLVPYIREASQRRFVRLLSASSAVVLIAFSLFSVMKTRIEYVRVFDRGGYLGLDTAAANTNDAYVLALLSIPGRLLPSGSASNPIPPYTIYLADGPECIPMRYPGEQLVAIEIADSPHQLVTGRTARVTLDVVIPSIERGVLSVWESNCQMKSTSVENNTIKRIETDAVVHQPIFLRLEYPDTAGILQSLRLTTDDLSVRNSVYLAE